MRALFRGCVCEYLHVRKRVLVAGAAALLVIVAAGAGFLAWRGEQACAPNRANAEAAPKTAGVENGTRAVILGDSYTTAWGLPDPTEGFAYRLADMEQWNAQVEGFPGTGYAVDGSCGNNSFDSRANYDTNPEVVVLAGGLNDVIFGSNYETAMADAIENAVAHAPKVYVLGIPTLSNVPADKASKADATLRDDAERLGAVFVPLADLKVQTVDGTHPDAAGHELIAERIASFVS